MGVIRENKTQEKDNKDFIMKGIQLENSVIISRQISSHMAFVGNFISSGFRIEANEKVIYIDPYKISETKPADYIFITHAHPDHLSMPDIEKLSKKETVIICPQKAVKKLTGYKIKEVGPKDIISLGDIQCEAVDAYYTKPIFLFIQGHPKTDMNVGYILNINGIRFYHMGDTHFIPEMKAVKDIDVVMVPIGVGTMNKVKAVEAINMINPRLVIPMHYVVEKADIQYLKQSCNPNIKIKTFED